MKRLEQYQHYLPRQLDYENFEVVNIVPQCKRFAVIVMRDKRDDAYTPWCLQFRGSGRYFFTRSELDEYGAGRGFW